MKRIVVFALIFVMLGYALILIRADVRSINDENFDFAKYISSESDGPVYAEAHIISDVDWPGEGDGNLDKLKSKLETLILGYGLEYEAWARYEGDAPNDDYEGTYEAYAGVPGDLTGDYHPRTDWDEGVDDEVKSTDRYNLHNNPDKWSDSEKERYGNWDDIRAETDLSLCSAWADIDGGSPAIPGKWVLVEGPSEVSGSKIAHWLQWQPGREAESHAAYGNAWKFPDSDQHNHN